jgi:ribosomal protein S18 acetylase RimI-like enzyme
MQGDFTVAVYANQVYDKNRLCEIYEDAMNIRMMTADDYGAVYALWKASPGIGLRPLDDSEEGIKKFLKRNPRASFVAEQDGEPAGAILGGHDGRRGYIYHAVVKEGFRGQSIGRALVKAVETAMGREGIHKIGLVSFKSNLGGNRFWKSLGYSIREDLVYRDKLISVNQTFE